MTISSTGKTHIIVPCAGFGTRVGSPPAKELLPHPRTQKPLIDTCLDLAVQTGWPLVLITRPEKKILMDYVSSQEKKYGLSVHWVLIKSSREWPESILTSRPQWGEKNLLILPDTEWNPASASIDMVKHLDHYDVCHGTFECSDLRTWGAVEISAQRIRVCEKPQGEVQGFKAWGLIAFKKSIGKILFESLLESTFDHKIKTLPCSGSQIVLESFKDLTRSPSMRG